jgi:cystathionine beta-lyase
MCTMSARTTADGGKTGDIPVAATGDSPFLSDLDRLRRRQSAKWRMWPPDALPVSVAELDVELAPCITRSLADAVATGDTGYAFWVRIPSTFSAWYGRRCGWAPNPAAMVVLPDVVSAIGAVLEVLTDPDDGVVIMPPVYPPFWSVVADVGRRVIEVPLATGPAGRSDIDEEELERALRAGARAVLLCSPHNPVGRVWSADELGRVAALAERTGALVISDEIHAPIRLPGASFTSYGSLGETRAVVVTSPSKAFNLAGLKCAVAVGCSDATAAALTRIPLHAQNATGHFGVLAAEAAMRDGDAWLDDLLAGLAANRRSLLSGLRTRLPEIAVVSPDAGYLAWLDCRGYQLGPDPAEVFLERGRVALSPGPSFGAEGNGFARLNFGTAPAVLEEALDRMVRALT